MTPNFLLPLNRNEDSEERKRTDIWIQLRRMNKFNTHHHDSYLRVPRYENLIKRKEGRDAEE